MFMASLLVDKQQIEDHQSILRKVKKEKGEGEGGGGGGEDLFNAGNY